MINREARSAMTGLFDFCIVGAGIVGLAIARELKSRHPVSRILILEKEAGLGKHASGRNSGVLHSGIFYAEDSLKARVCREGGKELADYCDEKKLPRYPCGKVIVPVREGDDARLQVLFERGKHNRIPVEIIDETRLKELEPAAHSISGKALHLPGVSIVDSVLVVKQIAEDLVESGVEIRYNTSFTNCNPKDGTLQVDGEKIAYGHLFNCAGTYADKVAKQFGVGEQYDILPFKGIYYRVAEGGPPVRGLIYAVPDPRVPFLGIHTSRNTHNEVYLGPTVVPALGRENYHGLQGLSAKESLTILGELVRLYIANKQGFRTFAHREALRFLKPSFYAGAHKLLPQLRIQDLLPSGKVGIRAQLVDVRKHELVMDFLFEQGDRSTHILNAVSPAFTSSFAFAKLILDEIQI